jgi:hypothetical protein
MWDAKKLLPRVPAIFVGVGLGCILYYLAKLAGFGGYLGSIIASGTDLPLRFSSRGFRVRPF